MELARALEPRGPSLVNKDCLVPFRPTVPLSPLTPPRRQRTGSDSRNPGSDLTCASKTRIPAAGSHTPSLPHLQTDLRSPSIKGKHLCQHFRVLSHSPFPVDEPNPGCGLCPPSPTPREVLRAGGETWTRREEGLGEPWVPCPLHTIKGQFRLL